jgi:CotS family spore coat protein
MHEIKSSFDELFLEDVDRYHNQAELSVELLRKSRYQLLCEDVSKNRNICHHDLAYHNMIIGNDGNIYFVDFDFCILDLRIHDIANLMVKAVKHNNWDMERVKNIIDSYCSIDELRMEELETLNAFLTFPQDFYEISRQYYMKSKKWDEEDFLARLQRKSGYYDDRNRMLEGFRDMLRGYK